MVESGLLEEFPVNTSLRQGSAFSHLRFVMVLELISRKIKKTTYADDLALITSKQELQDVLEEWKVVIKMQGLRMSMEKTEVIWIGHQRGLEH